MTTSPTTTYLKLYKHAQDADDALTAELERLFKRDACNRRYDAKQTGWDKAAKVAGNIKLIADARLRMAWNDMRAIYRLERATA